MQYPRYSHIILPNVLKNCGTYILNKIQMVVSINPEPNKEVFQLLLNNTVAFLKSDSKRKQEAYQKLLGNKLEDAVADVMIEKAKGTPFENSIELISGQRFPDIIANNYYGVEVKTSKQDHWTTTGNSVLEGTRVDGMKEFSCSLARW